MKQTSCIFILLLNFFSTEGQDYIKTKNDLVMDVKILEVGLNAIEYLRTSDSTIHFIANKDVASFKYDFTKKDSSSRNPVGESSSTMYNNLPMYNKGVRDAEYYYHGYKPGASGTYWTTVAAGPGPGLIPAFIISSHPPDEKKLGFPDSLLMKDPDYYRGYTKHAREKKVQRIWKSYTAGVITDLIVITLLVFL